MGLWLLVAMAFTHGRRRAQELMDFAEKEKVPNFLADVAKPVTQDFFFFFLFFFNSGAFFISKSKL